METYWLGGCFTRDRALRHSVAFHRGAAERSAAQGFDRGLPHVCIVDERPDPAFPGELQFKVRVDWLSDDDVAAYATFCHRSPEWVRTVLGHRQRRTRCQ